MRATPCIPEPKAPPKALPLGQVPPPPPLPQRVARFSRCEEPELTIWLLTEAGWVEEERLSLEEAQALADVTPDLDLRLDILARLDGALVECAEVDWCHNFAVTDVCWSHGATDEI